MMHAVIMPRCCARSGSVTAAATAISLYSPVRDGMGFLRAAGHAVAASCSASAKEVEYNALQAGPPYQVVAHRKKAA
jgi:hypothetical protein